MINSLNAAFCRTEPPQPTEPPQQTEPTDVLDRTADTEAPTSDSAASEPHSKPESPTEVFESEESSSSCHFSEITHLPAPSEVPSDQEEDDRT